MSITDAAVEVFGQECIEGILDVFAFMAVLGKVAIKAGHFGGDAPLDWGESR